MEVNLRKSEVEPQRHLAVNIDNLSATPEAKSNIMPCIPLHLVGTAERGPYGFGSVWSPYSTLDIGHTSFTIKGLNFDFYLVR